MFFDYSQAWDIDHLSRKPDPVLTSLTVTKVL